MRVLLAVDLRQAHADVVVRTAEDWIRRLGATVDLVYVDEFRGAQPFVHDPDLEPLLKAEWDRMEREDNAELRRLLEILPPENRGKGVLVTGTAAQAVVDLSPGYDGVLVATHGRKGLTHMWLGSVAERIVRACTKPVVVLRLPPGAGA